MLWEHVIAKIPVLNYQHAMEAKGADFEGCDFDDEQFCYYDMVGAVLMH